jgi:hypothetical protein
LLSGAFRFLETEFVKPLEMQSFFPPHIILGFGKQQDLRNQIFQTVGDALITYDKVFPIVTKCLAF